MPAFLDLTGKRFGKLVVISKTNKRSGSSVVWLCKCDCGNTKKISSNTLRRGESKSCGCIHQPHGHCRRGKRTAEYITYINMLARCYNPNDDRYPDYGGRGIKVCSRWRKGFEFFIADMGPKPKGFQIDRKNNSKGYFPKNCHWASRKQNANNKRNNVLITIKGKTQTITQWSKDFNLKLSSVYSRINRGMSAKQALLTPMEKR